LTACLAFKVDRRMYRMPIQTVTTDAAATFSRSVRCLLIATTALLAVVAWPAATTAIAPRQAAPQCVRPAGVQRLVFSATEYPNIRRHFRRAVLRRGWPLG
jgi:hypothetical protein